MFYLIYKPKNLWNIKHISDGSTPCFSDSIEKECVQIPELLLNTKKIKHFIKIP